MLVDGKPAEAAIKRVTPGKDTLADMDYHRVHTFPVTFAPKQRRFIRHTYRHQGVIISPTCSQMTYILETGALWQGAIKALDITLEVIDRFEQVQEYAGWLDGTKGKTKPTIRETPHGAIYRWALRDHEPTDDLSLTFCEPDAVARLEAMTEVDVIEDAELRAMSPEALRIARNTYYAAYGYAFQSDDLKAHFGETGWYRPRADFDPRWIDAERMKRIALFKQLEAEKKAAAKKPAAETPAAEVPAQRE